MPHTKKHLNTLTAPLLSNGHVRLELSSLDHASGLQAATADGELWKLHYTYAPTVEGVTAEIERRLTQFALGGMIPFTVIQTRNGIDTIVGMTTFLNFECSTAYKRVEIGATWYARSAQGTGINTAAKYLMLKHAFEEWQTIAVELRTHRLNSQSRRAIEGLGAQLDAILRAQRIMPNGNTRDTAVYSITATEWPTIKTHLEFKLHQHKNRISPPRKP